MDQDKDLSTRPPKVTAPVVDDDDDEDLEETLTERLIGLGEMFPEPVRNMTSSIFGLVQNTIKGVYHYGRSGMWVIASSATILVLPLMFEIERSQMEEHQLQQQRQILLGPNAAMSGQGPSPGLGAAPGMVPLPAPPAQR